MEEEAVTACIATVSVKLLPLWSVGPQLWFTQGEAQFATWGITMQKTRFDYIVAFVLPEFATEVCDLLLQPPTKNPYTIIKSNWLSKQLIPNN